jgi:8-oxo-dGTP diphosphatase
MTHSPASIRYTLCFLTRGDHVLLLHRRNPPNQGLWNGVGGRIEPGERPLASVLREVREETGYILTGARFEGLLTWEGFETPPGGLYLFTAQAPPGEPAVCSEGELAWKALAWMFSSPQVVSNLHVVGPAILGIAPVPPQTYHFVYQAGSLVRYEIQPLLSDIIVA